MKKFFSLICAFAIAMSVIAAPVSKKDLADKKVAKKEIRHQQSIKKAPATAVPFKTIEKTAAPKWVEKKAGVKEFKAVKVVKAEVAKAPQAKKETINLFTGDDVEFKWKDAVASGGWWQFQAEDDDYYMSLSNNYTEEVAGAYAWEDMDPDYTVLYSVAAEDYVELVDCNINLATPEGEDFTLIITGTLEDADGNIYNLNITYSEEIPEPIVIPYGGEFECDEADFTFYSTDNDAWYKLTVEELDATFTFDIVVAEGLRDVEPGKTYKLKEDMLANYSYVYFGDEKRTFLDATFLKTLKEDGSGDIYATALTADSAVWSLHYAVPAPPVAENFETITADVTYTSELVLFWTSYTFEAADEKNAIVLEMMPDDSFFGTWIAPDDISGAVTPVDGEESEIVSGEVTIAATAEGFKITGKVLCENLTEYTLDLTYVVPDPTRQAEFNISGLELTLFDGAWQLMGFSEDSTKNASIAAYADEVSGDYTEADLLAEYCALYDGIEFNEGGEIIALNEYTMLKANLHVVFNEADSTIVITGTYLGQNGEDVPEFTVNISGRIPAQEVSSMTFAFSVDPEDGITVTPSNEDPWDYYFASEAVFENYGADYIAEAIYGDSGNKYAITGTKTFAWDDEELLYYCAQGGVFYLVVWGSGENNITTEAAYVEFEFESTIPEGCTQYDAIDEDFIHDFAEYNVDVQYLANYGVLIIDATDAQNNYISLEAEISAVVPGVYTVGEEIAAGYIDSYIYGSFAGSLTASGQINVPFWCLVAGTVTVNEDLSIDVDAVNCAGAIIKSHLANGEEGVENADAAKVATKRVVNGQLIIEKNGVRYNAIGTIVK